MNEIASLKKLFEDFNSATDSLRRAYGDLEEKFHQINVELERKNSDLERSIAEKEEMKNYLQNILESLTDGVIVTDLNGKIQHMNKAAGLLAETQETESLGKHISEVLELPSDGEWEGVPTSGYFRKKVKSRNKLKGKTIEIINAPLVSTNMEVHGGVLVLRDITRVEILEEMANRNEKFALMTSMAAYIAEEIRNPLGSIELFVGLLLKDLHQQRYRERLEQIEMSVKKMDYKIANLLMFSETRIPQMERVDINEMLKGALSFAEYLASQGNIEMDCHFSDNLPYFVGDAEMLKQAFLNIILNSIQAMPDGGRMTIGTRIFREGAPNAPGSFLEIVFQDTGIGIPEDSLPKIFDPFFSTKEGRSGLGLTIVHNIVYLHKGTVHIEAAKGGGTVATVLLPYGDNAP